MSQKPAKISTESQNESLKLSKLLRYRFSAWLIAKGLRYFIKESIFPEKYRLDVSYEQGHLLSFIFASKVLHDELANNTDAGVAYLAQRKTIALSTSNAMFSLYLHFTKCLSEVYGDAAALISLNDAIFARGVASFYEDIVSGNLPIINQLPPEEASAMKRVREYMESEAVQQQKAVQEAIKENKDVLN